MCVLIACDRPVTSPASCATVAWLTSRAPVWFWNVTTPQASQQYDSSAHCDQPCTVHGGGLFGGCVQQGFDQQGALQLLLAKETRLLQTLDKLRVNAKQEVKALSTHKMLNHLAQPKTWTLSNGKKVRNCALAAAFVPPPAAAAAAQPSVGNCTVAHIANHTARLQATTWLAALPHCEGFWSCTFTRQAGVLHDSGTCCGAVSFYARRTR